MIPSIRGSMMVRTVSLRYIFGIVVLGLFLLENKMQWPHANRKVVSRLS